MGKQGPCYHCGVASTPLWRNGPPEKPVLCNACGSRWRTKGTLVNYTPLHARVDPGDYEDHRTGRMKSGSLKKKDEKLNKRKVKDEYTTASDREFSHEYSHQGQHNKNNVDEDMSTRSSFGSAVSNSESCAQFGSGADASELTGPSQSIVWDSVIPSRKRTCMTRPKQSSVEKLTKDLYTIYHEQASQFSGCSEEDLLYESDAPMVSVEIGHGSVLIRHPSTMVKEEESEASSLSVDNKLCRSYERYSSNAASLMSINDSKSMSNSKLDCQITQLAQPKREKFNHEKLQVLCNHKSPLSYIDLTEIVNFDVFQGHLTDEEQQCLLKYLPSVDTSAGFDSLENIFASTHIKESLSSFQQLLADGVLDSSFSGFKPEDCKILKRLALCTASKFKWVEHYNTLKKQAEESTEEQVSKTGPKSRAAGTLISGNRFRGNHNHNGAEAKFTVKTPERATLKAEHKKKATLMQEELPTPNNIFSLPSTGVSTEHLILDSSSSMMHYEEDNDDDDDLLLEVPSNSSFPQAELLCPTTSSHVSQQQASACSSSTYPFNFRT